MWFLKNSEVFIIARNGSRGRRRLIAFGSRGCERNMRARGISFWFVEGESGRFCLSIRYDFYFFFSFRV